MEEIQQVKDTSLDIENKNDVFSKPNLPDIIPSSKQQQQTTKIIEQIQKHDYIEPNWSSKPNPNDKYYFECIKNGTILENIDLNEKSFYTVGRYYTCDLILEHPSLSRFHAIIQYSNGEIDANYQKGFYLFDMNSTHGTMINKQKMVPKTYTYIKIGSCVKFGGSTRLYILNGPDLPNADDLNINLTHEQMKKLREKQTKLALKLRIQKEIEEEEENASKNNENEEIDWGLNNDTETPDAKIGSGDAAILTNVTFNCDKTSDDSFYASDPRKALKIFFEREGDELEYECDELGCGRFKCRIRLPIDNDFGEPVFAEIANFEGKKKDCQAQCALEACRILDSVGILRQSSKEYKRKRIEKDWQTNDYYDSDDDTYLDRTGDVEKKRLKRIDKFSGGNDELEKKVLTFESLKNDFKVLNKELIDINLKLDKCKNIINAVQNDDVDAYINFLKIRDNNKLDTITRTKLKRRIIDINQEFIKIDKFLNLAKPCGFDLVKWKVDLVNEMKNCVVVKKEEVVVADVVVKKEPVFSLPEKIVRNSEKNVKIELGKKEHVDKVEKIEKVEKVYIPKAVKIDIESNIEMKKSYDDFNNDKDYAMWLPPDDQMGDGKTKLNEKFGY
jgi:pSer/pThr/pTyr-binding forkhead associated (FHA) protein